MNVFQLNSSIRRLNRQNISQKSTTTTDVDIPASEFRPNFKANEFKPNKEHPEKRHRPVDTDLSQSHGFIFQERDINRITKPFSSLSGLLRPNLHNMSMQQLTDKAELVRFSILNPKLSTDSIPSLRQQLSAVYDVLEHRALEELKQFLVTADASADNTLSRSELELLSANPALSEDTRLAASFLLGYKSRLKALDLPGSSKDEPDVNISVSDIQDGKPQMIADSHSHPLPTYRDDDEVELR